MRRWGLTATFAMVSLLAMSAVGVGLVLAIGKQAKSNAIDEAIRTAEAYVAAAVILAPPDALAGREDLSKEARGKLDDLTQVPGNRLRAVRLWTSDSQLVYGTDSDGGRFPDGLRLDAALTGKPAAKVVDEVESNGVLGGVQSRSLSVYLPIRARGGGEPIGAAEVVLDYTATDQAIWRGMRLVALVVVAGLGILWLLLFRTVYNASRRLRNHATENARLALLDPLTGLPNRRLLSERIDRAIAASSRSGDSVALLILDVDGFKEINDTLGHDSGDLLLIEVASRIRSVLREADTVARLGGDEFAILMPVVTEEDHASQLANRVLAVFGEAFDLAGMALHVDASLGVAILPQHADDQMTLMRHADVAMYAAKRAKVGFSVYSQAGDHHSAQRLTLMGDLRQALTSNDQLALHYQPKIDLRSGKVTGLEALLRWQHPENGFMSPGEFIPLAEQTGLVRDLTQWVLEEAVGQVSVWESDHAPVPLDVAVNLSARNLHEGSLSERVRQLLLDARVSPTSIELEITESAIPGDAGRARDVMHDLAQQGVRLAIDDFGIGNTSISQLRSFPLRTLKIDRSFVVPLSTDAGSIVLVRAIIDLAHEFGLVVVAEGIEDAVTAAMLRELDCDLAQGFLWSPAVPADEIVSTIAAIDAAADERVAVTSGSARRGRSQRSR